METESWNTTWRYEEYIIRYELVTDVSTDVSRGSNGLLESNPGVATNQACRNDRAVLHEVVWEEGMASIVTLPGHEEEDEADSEANHAYKHWRAKAVLLVNCKGPWKKKHGESTGDEYDPDHCDH